MVLESKKRCFGGF